MLRHCAYKLFLAVIFITWISPTLSSSPPPNEATATTTCSSENGRSEAARPSNDFIRVGHHGEDEPTLRVILIRHGESQNNIHNEIRPEIYLQNRVPDPALTERGQRQAQQTGDYLAKQSGRRGGDGTMKNALLSSIDEIFVSPLLRTLQTAQPIAEALQLQPRVWPQIYEVGGVHEGGQGRPGMTRKEMTAQFPTYVIAEDVTDDGWYFAKTKETRETARERVDQVWEALKGRVREMSLSDHQTIALVVHGDFINLLLQAALGVAGTGKVFQCFNTCISVLDVTPKRTRILFQNSVVHLSQDLVKYDKLGKC